MKPISLLLIAILFTACMPVPAPATATPTLTLTPTRTPTLTPTATITPPPTPEPTQIPFESGSSREFSPLLPAEWHKEWTGNVAGMNIPIIIGLANSVVHDEKTPISEVWMTQEGTDAVADAFLRAAHYRYTVIMGNSATYEEYLDILKQPRGGEVNLLIMDEDGKTRREAMIDPRQGFSLLMTDKIDTRLNTRFNRQLNVFFGVDGQGRLLFASNGFSRFENYKDTLVLGVSIKNYSLIYNEFMSLTNFGYVENKCLRNGDVPSTCKEPRMPVEVNNWWQKFLNMDNQMIADGNYTPTFGLVRP